MPKATSSEAPILTAPFQDIVLRSIQENLEVNHSVLANRELLCVVSQVGQEMSAALQRGNKIFFFGNGGSAADAEHLAAELVGRFERDRSSWPAIALTQNAAMLTSIANDYSYESVFARQLEGLGAKGDVAVGISTSGKSPNVLNALRAARKMAMVTVGMTGQAGMELTRLVDHCISIPSSRTARIQESHILIGHVLCEIVERALR